MANYYIRRNGKVIGPTPLENIQKLFKGGKIKDSDEISADQSRWSTLARFFQSQEDVEEAEEVEEVELAEEAEEVEEAEDEPSIQEEDSAVNIASKKQEKAMWSVTWWIGVCAVVLFCLGVVLGFVFGYYPDPGKLLPNRGNVNPGPAPFGGFRP